MPDPLLSAWIKLEANLIVNLTYQAKVFHIAGDTTVQVLAAYGAGIKAAGNNAAQVVKYSDAATALAAYKRIEAAINALAPVIQASELLLTSLSPNSGVSPGDTITITGSGFTVERDNYQVTVNTHVISGTFVDDNTLSFIAPAGTSGGSPYDVLVTRAVGGDNKTLATSLTYA